jgi:ferrous iron transport protein A
MKNQLKKCSIGDRVSLSNLKKGQKAKVLSLTVEDRSLRRKLLDMGITEGVQIKIKKVAPLGDPIDIELRGYELCIRKADLAMIFVEVIA